MFKVKQHAKTILFLCILSNAKNKSFYRNTMHEYIIVCISTPKTIVSWSILLSSPRRLHPHVPNKITCKYLSIARMGFVNQACAERHGAKFTYLIIWGYMLPYVCNTIQCKLGCERMMRISLCSVIIMCVNNDLKGSLFWKQ